jgi:hypothetical protein
MWHCGKFFLFTIFIEGGKEKVGIVESERDIELSLS